MSDDDLKVYKQGRPYIRGILALLFFMRLGPPPTGATFGYYFVMADDFLSEFEARRS